ncbi:(d)CMP kinase [Archaeoglobus profundus]|uniref:Cytidylate kinase n=1 Tax=Archaeoglobus profundus (strain DSM 5631 / JCM 9629 / NBRC 100127 / Av18) TaxID=572546 RepID=D2RE41_ARCPA|nr:AAA family ATPase [Archaeoglobus profundus]ADB58385.1 cytidylate kinase [Archaeoglobus profundus DSM 5631]
MKITISGLPGSGTTTVAKLLAERLGWKLISAGEVFRRLAMERGMSLEEFSRYAEENPDIDIYIDRMQRELAEKEENVVVEGRLSGWMIKDAFKVWIYADPEIRYERIAKREGIELSRARVETKRREELEKRRYKKFYSIDIDDISVYHIAINSGLFKPEEIVEIILKAFELVRRREDYHKQEQKQ